MQKIKLTQEKLNDILDSHKKWLDGEFTGKQADLSNKDLRGLDLSKRDLRYINLRGSDLRELDLRFLNLSGADLRGSNLRGSNLRWSDLSYADLREANLFGANLNNVNLYGANLHGANLVLVKLSWAIGVDLACPEEGSFIGFKKLRGRCFGKLLCKLKIPANAKRSSATSRSCRCSRAKVLEILAEDDEGNYTIPVDEGYSMHYDFKYTVGEYVRSHRWDNDRWNEDSDGIHFFVTREEAEKY